MERKYDLNTDPKENYVADSPPLEIPCFSDVAVKPLNEREILANHSANLRVEKL